MSRWIIRWEDQSGDDDRYVTRSADSANEALEDVNALLAGNTCFLTFQGGMGLEVDATDAFEVWCRATYDGADPLGVIEAIVTGDKIEFETTEGRLEIIRERGPFPRKETNET